MFNKDYQRILIWFWWNLIAQMSLLMSFSNPQKQIWQDCIFVIKSVNLKDALKWFDHEHIIAEFSVAFISYIKIKYVLGL